ncbi:MAG TPA: amidohydrolase family protein [Myxococcales bacterium]|nr:amidohydrolase family protein [Myxococcales bacterium]
MTHRLGWLTLAYALAAGATAAAQQRSSEAAADSVVFVNVRLFDGKSEKLSETTSVLVVGNKIARIGKTGAPPPGAREIDGGGRVLMPGLIDAHWHTFLCANTLPEVMNPDMSYLAVNAAAEAERTLMRGFTSVRDVGGPAFGLKRAIDEGVVRGPRIYPSGAAISQTSGHADFRRRDERPRRFGGGIPAAEASGLGILVDGVDEMLTAVRENLRLGASQIKIHGGGGVASLYDPLDVKQFLPEEMRAAVQAASDWGTYVAVHLYNVEGIRRALDAGVKSIEHGHLIDEPTMKLLAEKGAWLSTQPFTDDSLPRFPDEERNLKAKSIIEGTDRVYRLAKKYKVKLAWGTDLVFNPPMNRRQNANITKLTRWFSPAETLRMVTHDNGELLALSGKRNPFPGKLGVVEEGALADLLLVDGDPLKDVSVLENPDKSLLVIMKNGVIYKNALGSR